MTCWSHHFSFLHRAQKYRSKVSWHSKLEKRDSILASRSSNASSFEMRGSSFNDQGSRIQEARFSKRTMLYSHIAVEIFAPSISACSPSLRKKPERRRLWLTVVNRVLVYICINYFVLSVTVEKAHVGRKIALASVSRCEDRVSMIEDQGSKKLGFPKEQCCTVT